MIHEMLDAFGKPDGMRLSDVLLERCHVAPM
jgi:hypothetical protein